MKKIITNHILINATTSRVWDALTNPQQTKKYMFGCEAISDWNIGSSLEWKMDHEGKELVAVTGHIVDIQPGRFLAYTTFDPHSTIENIPANYLTVTYELTTENGQTMLTVTQGDYNTVADGERRYQEAFNNGEGWNPILVEIKKLLEV